MVASGPAAEAWAQVLVGSRLRVDGRLVPVDRGSEVAALLRARGSPVVVAPPGTGLRLVERVRAGLRSAVAARGPEPRALVPALVLGDTSRMAPELTEDFRTTGLSHLTAVSGANLTLLLAFVLLLARWAGVRGWWLRLTGLLAVAAFVGLCRTEPSVLRAAAMGLVALAALGAGGRRAGLRQLAVAMLALLLLDPFLSRSVGFALSVLASAGIIAWAQRWSGLLGRWLPRIVAESVAVPLAAHLATLPVVAAISGQVSVAGLAANALAGPFVGPATVLGFAAAGTSLVSGGLAAVFGFGAAWSAQAIITVAHLGAGLPGASWRWTVTPWSLAWLGLASCFAGLATAYVLARPGLALLLAAVMTAGLVAGPVQPGWPPRGWIFVACDVGQGDGLVLRAGPASAVVVDTGPDPAAMKRCLDQLGVRQVPLLLLTHFHADHVDGLDGVAAGRRLSHIWVSPLAAPAYEAVAVADRARRAGADLVSPGVGDTAAVGAVHLRVLGPVGPFGAPGGVGEVPDAESSAPNDNSLVVLAELDGIRLLLTGDIEPPAQRAILASGADLRAEVLKVPHHGSARQEADFLAATGARIAVVSAGQDNDYGHPAPRTQHLLRSRGMTLLRTDQGGSVAVLLRRGRLAAASQR